MAEIGDIVEAQGQRFVVLEYFGHPYSGRMARLLHVNRAGVRTQLGKDEAGLVVLESPQFSVGEPVTVNGLAGTYVGTEDDVSSVLLAARAKELKGGGHLQLDAAVCRISKALLVLENRI